MYHEELIEEGIVTQVNKGVAVVNLNDTGACSDCGAKMFCKPGDGEGKTLTAKDPYGVHPGDRVRVSVKGKSILTATFLLYGVPLVLLLVGIIWGMSIFNSNKELYSTLLGLGFIAVYSLIMSSFSKKKNNSKETLLPEIIFVKKNVPV